MGILEFLNNNSDALGVIFTFVLVVITFYYAHQARRSQKLVEKLIDSPMIVVSLLNDEVHPSSCLIVRVENVGTGTARNVRFQPSKNFKILGDFWLEDIGFLKNGIDYFASGQKYEFLINTIMGEEAWDELTQIPLEMTITYENSGREEHIEKSHLDFGAWVDMPLATSPLGSIAGTAKEMVKISKAMVKATNNVERKLNRYTHIRAGDKVQTREELPARIDGDLRRATTIPKGEICTVLEVTQEDITLEWDNAPDDDGRVVYRGWRTLSESFTVTKIKLPPKQE